MNGAFEGSVWGNCRFQSCAGQWSHHQCEQQTQTHRRRPPHIMSYTHKRLVGSLMLSKPFILLLLFSVCLPVIVFELRLINLFNRLAAAALGTYFHVIFHSTQKQKIHKITQKSTEPYGVLYTIDTAYKCNSAAPFWALAALPAHRKVKKVTTLCTPSEYV